MAEHRDKLDALAHALLKAESLNEEEIRDVTGLAEPPRQAGRGRDADHDRH